MEFLDPNYKKKHTRLLFVGYGLFAVLVTGLTTLLVLQASGYNINRGGEVVINSLLFVDSHPGGSRVLLNGIDQGTKTDSRLVVPEGEYDLEVQQDGYRSWKKTILLEGRKVEFAKYPFLFPENLASAKIADYPTATVLSQSLDRRWLLSQNSLTNGYQLFDLDNDKLPVISSAFSNLEDVDLNTSKIDVLEWSTDNRNLLMSVNTADVTSYYIYELRSSALPIKLELKKTAVADIRLNDRKTDEVYVLYETGALEKYDVSAGTSKSIALAVLEFEPYDTDLVLYATPNKDKTVVDVIINDELTEYKLQTLSYAEGATYSLGLATFDGDFIYAVGSSIDERLTIYENPVDYLKAQKPLLVLSHPKVNGLKQVKFSQNTRFVASLVDEGFVVYDAEEKSPIRFKLDGIPKDYDIKWMDGHRLFVDIDGKLRILEFDGQNSREFDEVISSKSVYFDKNYDNLYTLRPGQTDQELYQTKLIVK